LDNKIIFFLIIFSFWGCNKDKPNPPQTKSPNTIVANNGQLKFYEKIYWKTFGNCAAKKDCAEIKIEYPEIIPNGVAFDSINNHIKTLILNAPFTEDTYKTLDEKADSLFSNYISVQKEFKDYHIGWFIHSKVQITGIFNDIISIRTDEKMFTGGANIFYNVLFSNIDIKSGNEFFLEDIIKIDKLKKLKEIGENLFYELKEIPKNKSLESAGYWFEDKAFEFSDNFAITDSGLVSFYNLYEIAPRVYGTTELFIPKEKIVDFTNIYK